MLLAHGLSNPGSLSTSLNTDTCQRRSYATAWCSCPAFHLISESTSILAAHDSGVTICLDLVVTLWCDLVCTLKNCMPTKPGLLMVWIRTTSLNSCIAYLDAACALMCLVPR